MKKRLWILAAAVLLALVLAIPASASKAVDVSGTNYLMGFRELPVEVTRGDRCFATATHDWTWTGDISGESITEYRTVAKGPCAGIPGVWEETTHIENWFTGTVGGSDEGSIRISCPGKFSFDPPRWEFHCVLHSGTDGLANLHGTIQITWPFAEPGNPYWGEVHWDPQ